MPLPNVTAIPQALPLVMTLAGAVFLGESMGGRPPFSAPALGAM